MIKDLWGTKVIYCYVVKLPVFCHSFQCRKKLFRCRQNHFSLDKITYASQTCCTVSSNLTTNVQEADKIFLVQTKSPQYRQNNFSVDNITHVQSNTRKMVCQECLVAKCTGDFCVGKILFVQTKSFYCRLKHPYPVNYRKGGLFYCSKLLYQ